MSNAEEFARLTREFKEAYVQRVGSLQMIFQSVRAMRQVFQDQNLSRRREHKRNSAQAKRFLAAMKGLRRERTLR